MSLQGRINGMDCYIGFDSRGFYLHPIVCPLLVKRKAEPVTRGDRK